MIWVGRPGWARLLIAIRPGDTCLADRIEGLLSDMSANPGVRIPGDRRHANRHRIEREGVMLEEPLADQLRALGGRV